MEIQSMARSAGMERELPMQRRVNARLADAGGTSVAGLGGNVAGAWFGRFVRDHITVAIAVCAFAPMLLIGALGWLYAERLRQVVPVELTNLAAVKTMLQGMVHATRRPDSWGPMLQALSVLREPDHGGL